MLENTDKDTSTSSAMRLWIDYFYKKENRYSTGFTTFDNALEGGIEPGTVTAFSGQPGTGKTALLVQIANTIVNNGNDVIFISSDMNTAQLFDISYKQELYRIKKAEDDLSPVSDSRSEKAKSPEEVAEDIVRRCDPHLFIIGKDKWSASIEEIPGIVEDQHAFRPVIFLDYLQDFHSDTLPKIVTPKEVVEYAIRMINDLPSAYDATVICSCAINRENYNTTMQINAIRDSSQHDYKLENIVGLQFHGAERVGFSYEEAMNVSERNMDLVILKQRRGPAGIRIQYHFIGKYVTFEEKTGGDKQPEKISPVSFSDTDEYTESKLDYLYEGFEDYLWKKN
ncbi:MAG: hypothetical protein LUD18_07245 [Lachnospiraceae bacterium]|nr:hypothetical protein [Lachnospiraceae bacterium]